MRVPVQHLVVPLEICGRVPCHEFQRVGPLCYCPESLRAGVARPCLYASRLPQIFGCSTELRSRARCAVIHMAGLSREHSREAGVDLHLVKPVDPVALLQTLTRRIDAIARVAS